LTERRILLKPDTECLKDLTWVFDPFVDEFLVKVISHKSIKDA